MILENTMKFLINLSAAALLAVSLSGCIVWGGDHGDWHDDDWRHQQKENRALIGELELQTERSRVLMKLGAPSFSEAFSRDGSEYRILYYRTQHRHSDGETTIDETTPLVFKNDRLIGWGEEMLANIQN